MAHGTNSSESSSAASPATDEVDLTKLSRMADLAETLATGFHAQGIAALKTGDLDRAGKAETGFSNLFLGIRRAIALKARLRQQREDAQRRAAAQKDRRQDQKDRRRKTVAERVSRAIAVVKPEVQERLTADLWEKLIENDRIDADLADTALPIETLIRRLGREIGLADSAIVYGLDPDRTKADQAAAAAKAWSPAATPADDDTDDPDPEEEAPKTGFHYTIGVWAADYGGPERDRWTYCVTSGEIFDEDGNLVRTVPIPDEPWKAGGRDTAPPWLRRKAPSDPGGVGPPAAAGPPDPPPPLDPEEAEFQRQAAYAKQHGSTTLLRPPALARRLGLPENGTADGGPAPTPGNRSATDKRP